MKVGALILAAGASTRLGQPKQLVRMAGETLLDRSVRIATEAGCKPVIVILGSSEQEIRAQCRLQNALVVSHSNWAEGIGTTLSRGVQEFEDVQGILVMTCDMPAVTATHLQMLISSQRIAASSYGVQRGVPAYFPEDEFPQLLTLKGDVGARRLLRSAHTVELPGGELDIDSPDDLAMLQSCWLDPASSQEH